MITKNKVKVVYDYYTANGEDKTISNFKINLRTLHTYLSLYKWYEKQGDTIDADTDLLENFDFDDLMLFHEIMNEMKEHNMDIHELLNIKSNNIKLKSTIKKMQSEIDLLYDNKDIIEGIVQEFKDFIKNNTSIYSIPFNVTVNTINRGKNRLNNIMLCSDMHYAEKVNPRHVNFLAEYDMSIARSRVIKYFEQNLKLVKYTGADICYLIFLGDMISGTIHEELRETNEVPVSIAIFDLVDFFYHLIVEYSSQFDKIMCYSVIGNHGRFDRKPRLKNSVQDNYEYVFYRVLQERLIKNNIPLQVSESTDLLIHIEDITIKAQHGNFYKGGNNFLGLPAQTTSRDSLKERAMYDVIGEKFDILALGHFHQAGIVYDLFNKPIIFNPSIIGLSEVSKDLYHVGFPPAQYSLITDEKEIKDTRLIFLK